MKIVLEILPKNCSFFIRQTPGVLKEMFLFLFLHVPERKRVNKLVFFMIIYFLLLYVSHTHHHRHGQHRSNNKNLLKTFFSIFVLFLLECIYNLRLIIWSIIILITNRHCLEWRWRDDCFEYIKRRKKY